MPQPRQSSRKKTTSGSRSRSTTASDAQHAKDTAGVREQLARFLDPLDLLLLTHELVQDAVEEAVAAADHAKDARSW